MPQGVLDVARQAAQECAAAQGEQGAAMDTFMVKFLPEEAHVLESVNNGILQNEWATFASRFICYARCVPRDQLQLEGSPAT